MMFLYTRNAAVQTLHSYDKSIRKKGKNYEHTGIAKNGE